MKMSLEKIVKTPDFILKNQPLAQLTSWKVGGHAEYFCAPKNIEELISATKWAQEYQQNISVLSGGSNTLISDLGVLGLTLYLGQLKSISHHIDEYNQFKITAESGVAKSEVLKLYLKHKLAPALFLAGIPGDVGGGVVMNAGVGESFLPREFCEIVEWIEVLDLNNLKLKKLLHNEIIWSYRHSEGWQPGIITRVGLSWPHAIDESIIEKVKHANKVRLQKQPLDLPSCGSVFRNPPGLKSAILIDQAGLKGYTQGGAQVSLKHANFIVNINKATATDIHKLIQYVQAKVESVAQVKLQPEVVYLGQWEEQHDQQKQGQKT